MSNNYVEIKYSVKNIQRNMTFFCVLLININRIFKIQYSIDEWLTNNLHIFIKCERNWSSDLADRTNIEANRFAILLFHSKLSNFKSSWSRLNSFYIYIRIFKLCYITKISEVNIWCIFIAKWNCQF